MPPRPRKQLDPRSTDYKVRFAIHLRALLDNRGLSHLEFLAELNDAGLDVTREATKKWIRGERTPKPEDLIIIGRVLGLKDYRQVLPPK